MQLIVLQFRTKCARNIIVSLLMHLRKGKITRLSNFKKMRMSIVDKILHYCNHTTNGRIRNLTTIREKNYKRATSHRDIIACTGQGGCSRKVFIHFTSWIMLRLLVLPLHSAKVWWRHLAQQKQTTYI